MTNPTTSLNFGLILAILKMARDMMRDGVTSSPGPSPQFTYACNAVSYAGSKLKGDDADPEVKYIRDKISDYIGGAYTYDSYYADKNHVLLETISQKTLQDGRYEMIDQLIAHATPLAILQETKNTLWDGSGYRPEDSDCFICINMKFVTIRVLGLTEGNTYAAVAATPEYLGLQAWVSAGIGGYTSAEAFLQSIESEEPAYEFRLKLLDSIFATYLEKSGV